MLIYLVPLTTSLTSVFFYLSKYPLFNDMTCEIKSAEYFDIMKIFNLKDS